MYVGERGGRGARREYLDWQRVERRRDRGGLLVPRAAPEMSDERAVPEMHAVEDPDRQVDGSLGPAGEVRERFSRPRLVGRTHSGRRRLADGVERDWHRRGGRLRQKRGRRFANRARRRDDGRRRPPGPARYPPRSARCQERHRCEHRGDETEVIPLEIPPEEEEREERERIAREQRRDRGPLP